MTAPQLSVVFFVQMFFILAACRLVGWFSRKLGQPHVVGEMVAGVLIGPSLFGLLFPQLQQQLFPPESLKVLYVAAQLGVGLYMFLVGIDFNTELFRSRMRSAVSVSVAGILVPFACAAAMAPWLQSVPGLFSEQTKLFQGILFLGAAMGITAFPMLARIIYERGVTGTAVGTLALAAGAMNDAAACGVLAIVLAGFQTATAGNPAGWIALRAIGGGIAYAGLVLFAGRKLLAPLGRMVERQGRISPAQLGVVLMLFCLGAWITDAIGLHAVFGAFLLGVVMPRGLFARELRQKLQPLAVVFLLPIFFAYSGLNTRLDMVNSLELLLIGMAILGASIFGKGFACWAAARMSGEDNRTALAVGTLMNSRGLMELLILNIGLQRGIIQPALFSMLVLMAIVTTLMASPVFEWVYGRHARRAGELAAAAVEA